MTIEVKSHIYASLGTIVAIALLLLLLFFLQIAAPQVQEDEGIEVAFGVAEDGGGYQPSVEPAPQEEQNLYQPSAPSHPSDNDMIVQEDEESLQMAQQREEEARRIAQAEAERRAREAEEAAERARKEQAIARANAMGSLFGNSDEPTTGSGTGTGEQHKGSQVGTTPIGEKQYDLGNRKIVGTLPLPAQTFKEEGVVVVIIQVDKDGIVRSASPTGKGTNTSNDNLRQLAKAAALKAKFEPTDKPDLQIGYITYNFKLK